MTPEVNFNNLDRLIEEVTVEALKNAEIRSGAANAGLSDEFLTARLRQRSVKLKEAATNEVETYRSHEQRLDQDLSEARVKLDKSLPALPNILRRLDLLGSIASVILFFAVVGYVVSGFFIGWTTIFRWLWQLPGIVPVLLVVIAAIVVSFIYYDRRTKSYQQLRAGAFESGNSAYGIEAIQKNIESVRQSARQALIDKVIVPELRGIINAETTPSYDPTLVTVTAAGLAEVFNPAYEIPTAARAKIRRLISTMPGGSIGIAGPRGSGKSTLLSSICGTVQEINGQPVLSVMTSAPVEYDARDYILHLFSSACQRVLKLKNLPDGGDAWEEIVTPDSSAVESYRKLTRRLRAFCLVLGPLLLFAGIAFAVVMEEPETTAASQQASPVSPQTTQAVPPAASPSPSPAVASGSAFPKFVKALGVSPGTIALWGLFLTAIGIVLDLIDSRSLMIRAFLAYIRLMGPKNDREKSEVVPKAPPPQPEPEPSPLVREARNNLREIRFQQSFSSGWSGSLKLPVGLEGGINKAVQLAQKQLSLPEIVERFRAFISLAAQEYLMIIGIDELDKLESDEVAQRFLNEIKAIFGLDRCFYLISVSENAISSFERRGIPFRDVFDSSFDQIIYVDYLKLADSRRLLNRRVIGMPAPFLNLCHCMSGGLARDLIRSCRDLLELKELNEQDEQKKRNSDLNSLSDLCGSLLDADLKAKLRALTIAAKDIKLEPDVGQFLERVNRVEAAKATAQNLLDSYFQLGAGIVSVAQQNGDQPPPPPERDRIASLQTELASYLYYTATLLEFFVTTRPPASWQAAEATGQLDRLTRARQYLAVNSSVSRAIITEFRKSFGMKTASASQIVYT